MIRSIASYLPGWPLLGAVVLGCSGIAAPAAQRAPVARSAEPPLAPAPEAPKLLALTAREQEISRELAFVSRTLSQEIGERNVSKPWELAGAADFLVEHMEGLGLRVERRGFELDGGNVMAQNLSVSIAGENPERHWVIVGAAYDSGLGGGDVLADATGVAATIELAHALQAMHAKRSLRFVWCGNSAAQGGDLASLGSARCASDMTTAEEQVVAMLGLGNFAVGKSGGMAAWELLVDSDAASDRLGATVGTSLQSQLGSIFAVRRRRASEPVSAAGALRHQCPTAISISVGARAGRSRPTFDEVDFDATARVVAALEGVLRSLTADDSGESREPAPLSGSATTDGSNSTLGVDWTSDSLLSPERTH